jgi:hypothetical protein
MAQRKKKCPICGKPWTFRLKVVYDLDGKPLYCRHDENAGDLLRFDLTDQRIIKQLKRDEVLVKGSDGISRICKISKKK